MTDSSEHLVQYTNEVNRKLATGIATEGSFRSPLESLLERLDSDIEAINEPKRVESGAPDFEIVRPVDGDSLLVGHIEAKDVGTDLQKEVNSEQLTRYRSGLSNLILTDYVDFYLFRNGELSTTASLGTQISEAGLEVDESGLTRVNAVLSTFLDYEPDPVTDSEVLARKLARIAQLIQDSVLTGLEKDLASDRVSELRGALQEVLLPDLTDRQFSDIFAQTLTYGLFAARVNHDEAEGRFERIGATGEIPKTNPFLRKLFATVSGPELDNEPFAGFVDYLTQLLAECDMSAVLEKFGAASRGEDPVVHFYETFLSAYDPKTRQERGVYYTPTPVVDYIVSTTDELLRSEKFGVEDGITDTTLTTYEAEVEKGDEVTQVERQAHKVLLLDPACGTGTFLYRIIDLIRDKFRSSSNAGLWEGYVKTHLLPRLYGFELLMAPYSVAHLKLGMQLQAHDLPSDKQDRWKCSDIDEERLNVYLTNSLAKSFRHPDLLLGRFISQEAEAAAKIKNELPILVVLGNPPYSGHSANDNDHIKQLVADYKQGYPDLQRPAQAKWLQDDYVKFIRFGQERIERTGNGILAYITNNRYLKNRTFRGMRDTLMDTFDEIYVLNLHGDQTRKEVPPDGGPDENVFPTTAQGVAIGIFVKKDSSTDRASVYYEDVWGTRLEKHTWLAENSFSSTDWQEVPASEPLFLFVPRDEELRKEYSDGWRISEIFGRAGRPAPGIVTTHDEFAISFSEEQMEEKIETFLDTDSEEAARDKWRLCSQDQWDYDDAKRELSADSSWRDRIEKILYRPFDLRYTVYDSNVAVHRRERVSRHMLAGDNLGLITTKTVEIGRGFEHIFCTQNLIQHHTVSTKEVNYLFPTYLYPAEEDVDMGLYEEGARIPNVSREFRSALTDAVGVEFISEGFGDLTDNIGPEAISAYVYAILHSRSYRQRYSEFMEENFPRVPIVNDRSLFKSFVKRGRALIDCHLLSKSTPSKLSLRYPVPGPNTVASGYPKYQDKENGAGAIYLNDDQFIAGVSEKVWDFHIGGGRPARKWLRDRLYQDLSYEQLERYQDVLQRIARTVSEMSAIEDVVGKAGGWPLS